MTTFPLKIITQEKVLFREEVESLYVTTIDGDVEILAHHIPYVTILEPSEVIIQKNGVKESFVCTGGVLEVTPEKAVILADSAVRIEDIDEAEEEKVKARAEAVMAEKLEERERAETEAALKKALLHLHIAKKRRPRRGAGNSEPEMG